MEDPWEIVMAGYRKMLADSLSDERRAFMDSVMQPGPQKEAVDRALFSERYGYAPPRTPTHDIDGAPLAEVLPFDPGRRRRR